MHCITTLISMGSGPSSLPLQTKTLNFYLLGKFEKYFHLNEMASKFVVFYHSVFIQGREELVSSET